MPKSLTNFNVPDTVRQRFDYICGLSSRTRTSVLIELMERYIIDQGKVLESQNRQLEWIDQVITKFRPIDRSKGYQEPPTTHSRIGRPNRLKTKSPRLNDRTEG